MPLAIEFPLRGFDSDAGSAGTGWIVDQVRVGQGPARSMLAADWSDAPGQAVELQIHQEVALPAGGLGLNAFDDFADAVR